MTTLSLARDEDWQAVLGQLPRCYAELAQKHEQVETKFGNAKISTADTLLRFILLHVGANLPLRQTVALMEESGGPSLSPMRLHKKMRRAAPYLQDLVERMLGWASTAKPECWHGYSLVLVDATTVCGPGAIGTDARLHTKLRVADVALLDVVVTDVKTGETFRNFRFQPGELVLGDRIYANPKNVALALEQGADVLVRYNRGSLPLMHEGSKLDPLAKLRELADGDVLDMPVTVEHDDGPMAGRFIGCRLSEDAAERARRRLKQKASKKSEPVSSESLEAAGYMMLFTTVPRTRMAAQRCLDAYRLRWQIELQFKRWKSLGGFDRLPNYRDDTIIAWLYAKLLLALVLDRMSSIRSELSPPVQLEAIPARPRRRRRSKAEMLGAPALEAREHSLPLAAPSAPSALSA